MFDSFAGYSVGDTSDIFSAATDGFDRQMRSVCAEAAAKFSRRGLTVHLTLFIAAICPFELRESAFHAVTQMIGNAMEHGFYERQQGRIDISFTRRNAIEISLAVLDDGWGFDIGEVSEGHGFRLLRSLGEVTQNANTTNKDQQMTEVTLTLRSQSSKALPKSPSVSSPMLGGSDL